MVSGSSQISVFIFTPLGLLAILYFYFNRDRFGAVNQLFKGKIHLFLSLFCAFVAFISNAFFAYLLILLNDRFDYSNYAEAILQYPIIMLIYLCIVAPVLEETLFRGYFQTRLVKKYEGHYLVAIIVVNVFFALSHIGQGIKIVFTVFFPGLIFGLLRHRTNSLWPPVIAHSFMNLLVFITYWNRDAVKTFMNL